MQLKRYDDANIKQIHGDYEGYRKLYKGQHHELFERAQTLIEQGELFTDRKTVNVRSSNNVRTPYLSINVCKVIVDTPVMLINNSLGDIVSAYSNRTDDTPELDKESAAEALEDVEDMSDEEYIKAVASVQQKRIDEITDNSDIDHQKLLTQLHIDGGIVGIPEYRDGRIEIVFKERNVYFPIDRKKAELVYLFTHENQQYVHIHRETIVREGVKVEEEIYKVNNEAKRGDQMSDAFMLEMFGIENPRYTMPGFQNFIFEYLGYNTTFMDPLGVSALEGQADKQEEINWTVTRAAQTFERNGKPRITISKETMKEAKRVTKQRTGKDDRIDHRLLEITVADEKGRGMEYHQIDISKIGNMDHVKEIIKAMLMETQTSIQAVDFVSGTSSAQSGRARFYDWATSVLKAGEVRARYQEFIQRLYEKALMLLSYYEDGVIVERPHITTFDIAIKSHDEKVEEEIKKYAAGVQSLETTVRNIHPTRSNEWINQEIERIEAESENNDTMSLLRGPQSARQFNDNRPLPGEPQEGDGEGGTE